MVDIPKCDDTNREVFHHKLDYQPGHVIHHGKTNRSYNWFPIAPSPVASHTRAKIRVVKFFFVCFFVWSCLMGQVWPAAIVVCVKIAHTCTLYM